MIEHLGAKGWEICDLDEISPGQPFRLKLMSALLRDAGDPDWQVLLEAQRGLLVGIKSPLPRTPEVYEEQTLLETGDGTRRCSEGLEGEL